jgi:hypothetical protein
LPSTLTFHLLEHITLLVPLHVLPLVIHWYLRYLLGKEVEEKNTTKMEQRKEQAAASTTPSSGGEGAATAPLVDAQKRERCWAARGTCPPPTKACAAGHWHTRGTSSFFYIRADAYHACIDGSKTGGSEEECGAALRLYAAECPRSWVRTEPVTAVWPRRTSLTRVSLWLCCVCVCARACSTQLLHFEKRRKADQERSAREAAYQNRQRG